METETATWSEFLNAEKSYFRTNTRICRKKCTQKTMIMRVIVRNLSRKLNHLSNVIQEQSVLMTMVEVSADKCISRWVDWENPIYFRCNSIKTMDKEEDGDQERKKKLDTEWSKADQNHTVNKTPQRFLNICPMQKGVLPSHNRKTMHMNNWMLLN